MPTSTKPTTLASIAVAGALALVPLAVAAPAGAAEATCDGRAATITVVLPPGSHTSDPVTGTPGDDVIVGTEGDDTIDGGGGNDVLCGLGGADTLVGGDGNDRLFGGADAPYEPDEGYFGDLLVPGAGDDHVDLGTGDDDIWFWESPLEVDQVSYADAPTGVQVDLAAGTATGHGTDTIVTGTPGRPVGVIGSAHDDVLLGTEGRDVVDAGAGDDTIRTGDGADVVLPDGPGRTTSGWRLGETDPDPVAQPGDDTVSTGAGSDGVWVQRGSDVVRGGGDVDRLTATSPESGTRLLGQGGKDRITSDPGTAIDGGSGDDRISVVAAPGRGRSEWVGGPGQDTLTITTPRGRIARTLLVDVPRRRVDRDGDRLASASGVERWQAFGTIVRAVFRGGRGDDRFASSARRVVARGGAGDDVLSGGRRPDLLVGGPGRDRLDGSGGRDRCLSGERLRGCELRR